MKGAAARSAPAWRLPIAMAASMWLHLALVVGLRPAPPPPQDERFSQQAIEVTLEMALAPPAAPPPPALAYAGQLRPPGAIDLVHTAQTAGPAESVLPLQRPLPELPEAPPLSTTWRPAEVALQKATLMLEEPPFAVPEPLAGAPSAAAHAPDALDRLQAPPRRQPEQQATRQVPRQGPAAPTATPANGAPARRNEAASRASQHDAEQDYVLLVVHKLAQASFSTAPAARRSEGGAVIARLTVDRDGALLGLSLARGSGSADVDRGILDHVRKTAPFPPLPATAAAARFSFIVPIKYAPEP